MYEKTHLIGRDASEPQIRYAASIAKDLLLDVTLHDAFDHWLFINTFADLHKRIRKNCEAELRQNRFIPRHNQKDVGWSVSGLHRVSGIYAFVDDDDGVLYIGKSVDLASRIPSSYSERCKYADIEKIKYYPCDNKSDASVLEIILICENQPVLNTESKHDVAPERFRSGLSVKEDFIEVKIIHSVSGNVFQEYETEDRIRESIESFVYNVFEKDVHDAMETYKSRRKQSLTVALIR